MNMIKLALSGGWDVLVASLIFGVGAPLVYALAMRARVTGAKVVDGPGGGQRLELRPVGKAASYVLLVICVGIVALGITMIAADGMGKTVSFERIFPTLVDG